MNENTNGPRARSLPPAAKPTKSRQKSSLRNQSFFFVNYFRTQTTNQPPLPPLNFRSKVLSYGTPYEKKARGSNQKAMSFFSAAVDIRNEILNTMKLSTILGPMLLIRRQKSKGKYQNGSLTSATSPKMLTQNLKIASCSFIDHYQRKPLKKCSETSFFNLPFQS